MRIRSLLPEHYFDSPTIAVVVYNQLTFQLEMQKIQFKVYYFFLKVGIHTYIHVMYMTCTCI